MTTETLKDIFKWNEPRTEIYINLRREAIKEYKYFSKKLRYNEFTQDETRDFILGKLHYIKWKNNLTEEDLK